MFRKYPKTNLFIIDQALWNWSKYQASSLENSSVSEYVFELIKAEKKGQYEGEIFEVEPEKCLAIGHPETPDRAGLYLTIDNIFRRHIGKKVKFTIKVVEKTEE